MVVPLFYYQIKQTSKTFQLYLYFKVNDLGRSIRINNALIGTNKFIFALSKAHLMTKNVRPYINIRLYLAFARIEELCRQDSSIDVEKKKVS